MKIALGSSRAAKIMAVRAGVARLATVDATWDKAELVARTVETDAPAMPLTDSQLMRGARLRAEAVQQLLLDERDSAHFYIGLEGGFHSITLDGERRTFLRGWAYVTDGGRGSYGAAPSVEVPERIVRRVFESKRELGDIIDELAGAVDVRSRQGAWGILSRDLLTRAQSFETAVVAAFAPFYNAALYYHS